MVTFPTWKVDSLGPPAADYSGMLTGLASNFEGAMERSQQRRYVDEAAELAKKYGGTFVNGQYVPAGGAASVSGAGGGGGGGGGGVSTASGDAVGRATEYAKYLVEKHGFSREAAAGIAGHMIEESGANPGTAAGDAGKSRYMFQWDPTRTANFLNWAKANGRNPSEGLSQVDYMVEETKTGAGGNVYGRLTTPGISTKEATDAFFGFERPGGYKPGNPTGVPSYGSRQAHAERVYGRLGEVLPTQSAQAGVPAGTVPGASVATPAPPVRPVAPVVGTAASAGVGGIGGPGGLGAVPTPARATAAVPGPAAAVAPRLLPGIPNIGVASAPPGPGYAATASADGAPVVANIPPAGGGGGGGAAPVIVPPLVGPGSVAPGGGGPPAVPTLPSGGGPAPGALPVLAGGAGAPPPPPPAPVVAAAAAPVAAAPAPGAGKPLGTPAPVRPAGATAPGGAISIGGGQGIPGDLLAAMIRVPGLREYAGKYLAEKATAAKGTSFQIVGPNDSAARAALGIPADDKRAYQVDLTTRKAEPISEPPKDTQTFEQESTLRKEFEGHQTVKDYRALEQGVQGLDAAFSQGNPAGDLVAVNQIMKAIDPGSTVSAGETANVTNAAGIPDTVRAAWNKLFGDGGQVSPENRANFYNTIVSLAENRRTQADQIATTTRNRAKSYPGLNADRVVEWQPAKFERRTKDDFLDTPKGSGSMEEPFMVPDAATAEKLVKKRGLKGRIFQLPNGQRFEGT